MCPGRRSVREALNNLNSFRRGGITQDKYDRKARELKERRNEIGLRIDPGRRKRGRQQPGFLFRTPLLTFKLVPFGLGLYNLAEITLSEIGVRHDRVVHWRRPPLGA